MSDGSEVVRTRIGGDRSAISLHAPAGDPEEFFRTYRGPLTRFFRKRIGLDADVDDLVQEVFCRIFAVGEHDRLENPNAYIFQVAANLVRDRARRARTRDAFTDDLAQEATDRVEEISPERVLQGRQAGGASAGARAERVAREDQGGFSSAPFRRTQVQGNCRAAGHFGKFRRKAHDGRDKARLGANGKRR